MFMAVVVGWVLFRSPDFAVAWALLRKMFIPTAGALVENAPAMALLLAGAAWWAMRGPNGIDLHRDWAPRPVRAIALSAAFGACMGLMLGNGSSPFLYFQF
jgi:hypothetical protein